MILAKSYPNIITRKMGVNGDKIQYSHPSLYLILFLKKKYLHPNEKMTKLTWLLLGPVIYLYVILAVLHHM